MDDTYDLDKTLVGFRVTFCLVRESVSSITPRNKGPKTRLWKERMGHKVKTQPQILRPNLRLIASTPAVAYFDHTCQLASTMSQHPINVSLISFGI